MDMENDCSYGKKYALLTAVGDYRNMDPADLPTYRMDQSLIEAGLIQGLKFEPDHLRKLGQDGRVQAAELARALKEFSAMLEADDTFVFYFSGHGRNDEIVFSDMSIQLNSILNYVEQLPCKNKIVILDCCYSGDFVTAGPRKMSIGDAVSAFSGHGICIMASSAANELSRLNESGTHSLFTGVVGTAMMSRKRIRKGLVSLEDLSHEIFTLIHVWNEQKPDQQQNPVIRNCIGGTIYFAVEEYRPYVRKQIYLERSEYIIWAVEPLNSSKVKRLCAFILLKRSMSAAERSRITWEIALSIRYAEVHSTKRSESRFKDTPARVVWCYFGMSESDLIHHLYIGYSIWTSDAEMARIYYSENENAQVLNGIYLFENTAYALLKKMQTISVSRDEYIRENKRLLAKIVTLAGQYIYDLHEVLNRTKTLTDLQAEYSAWSRKAEMAYVELSELDVPPDDLYDWAMEIQSLAGCVLDMALLIKRPVGDGEMWLINHAVGEYASALEKLKEYERVIDGGER